MREPVRPKREPQELGVLSLSRRDGGIRMSRQSSASARRTLGNRPTPSTKPGRRLVGGVALVVTLAMAALSGCAASTTTPTAAPTKDPAADAAKPAAKSETAAVPRLVGLTLSEVKAALRHAGLTIGVVKREPSARAAGTVLRQGSAPGAALGSGSPVTVVVAAPLPMVPSVIGSSKAAALGQLRAAGFGAQVSMKTTTSGADGVVLSESPAAGDRAKPGAVVTLVISDLHKPPTLSSAGGSGCTPGYTPCLPPASDYDCAGGSGDGPKYTGLVHVTGSDPYDLDRDGDGIGCDT